MRISTPTWIREEIRHNGRNYPAGTLGVEIEVEGRNLPRTIFRNWLIHDDGSLRGAENCEYVLREPQTRAGVEESLDYLEGLFNDAEARIDAESDRTSVHIHLNCQNKTWTEIFTIWTLWTIVEDLSFELCGDERRGNLFCLRMKDCGEGLIQNTKDMLEAGNWPFGANDYRYSAINLQAIQKFGSLEFRGMHGTVDKKEILTWIDFLIAVLKAAKEFDNPHEVVSKFSQVGVDNFFTEILPLPRDMVKKLQGYREWRASLWEGMRLAQDVAWILTNWGEKKKEKKEKITTDTFTIYRNVNAGPVVEEARPVNPIQFEAPPPRRPGGLQWDDPPNPPRWGQPAQPQNEDDAVRRLRRMAEAVEADREAWRLRIPEQLDHVVAQAEPHQPARRRRVRAANRNGI